MAMRPYPAFRRYGISPPLPPDLETEELRLGQGLTFGTGDAWLRGSGLGQDSPFFGAVAVEFRPLFSVSCGLPGSLHQDYITHSKVLILISVKVLGFVLGFVLRKFL
jgi:hypothetical protein